jgi:hypothetical protein
MENKDEFKELNFSDLEEDKGNDWTWEKNYDFRDPVVSRVVKQFVDRSNTGYKKYGQTLDSERRKGVKNLGDYLQDVQEELMDAILYIQAAKEDLACTPQCKCTVEDVNNKITIGDIQALNDLKEKMDFKKAEKNQVKWFKENYPQNYVSDHT